MPLYTSYSEETQTLIEEFLENTFGWDEDELVGFIEIFGEEKFKLYFEEYADMVDDIGNDVVSAFLNVLILKVYKVAVMPIWVNMKVVLSSLKVLLKIAAMFLEICQVG